MLFRSLADALLAAHRGVYARPAGGPVVLNTDFAQEAVRRGRAAAAEGVAWARVDLLAWGDVRALRDRTREAEGRCFAFVVDKSTTDAIACRGDVGFSREACAVGECHPAIVAATLESPAGRVEAHPAAVLAHHVAALVEEGGVWIALSYSSNRFPFLAGDGNDQDSDDKIEAAVRAVWKLERVEAVKVKEESAARGSTVHTPEVFHYLYILRRLAGDVPTN